MTGVEMNEIGYKKIEKRKVTNACLRLIIRRKRKETQTINIRNKRRHVTTDPTVIKIRRRNYE